MNRERSELRAKSQMGQIVPIALFMIIPFVLLIAMVFNTGEHIMRKIMVQNAADAAAMTQATWTARALNVMAMNNVAITQAFVVHTVGSAVHPVLQQAAPLVGREILYDIPREYGQPCATWFPRMQICASCVPPNFVGCGACAYAVGQVARYCGCMVGRLDHYDDNILGPYEDLWSDLGFSGNIVNQMIRGSFDFSGGPKIREFGQIAAALAAMNKKIVEDFPAITERLNAELAQENGLSDPPRFFTAYRANDVARQNGYRTTGLPVKAIDFGGNAGDTAISLLGLAPITYTGERGSPRQTPKQFWNFQQHGYQIGRGPYLVARDRASREVRRFTDALGQQQVPNKVTEILGSFLSKFLSFIPQCNGPDKDVPADFDQIVDACWPLASSTHFLPGGNCLVPIRARRIDVYELDQDFSSRLGTRIGLGNFVGNPDDFSLISFTRSAREGGAIAPTRFYNPPGAAFGYGQAQIFNDTYPDLYTQNWRAKMRKASLLEGQYRDGALEATTDFAALKQFLQNFNSTQQRQLNAH